MKYFLQFVIFSLISTVFGFVEISFMEGVPRLNNSAYYDYYFACHAEGETLQWIVNNSTISGYSGLSTLGNVLSRSISNCNYITTLLTLMAVPSGMSVFDSVLIISCQNSTSLNVVCTDGSTLSEAGNPEMSPTTMAENSSTSVNLELVLNQNLVNTDSSSCTNIFVCGVDNNLMTWQVQGNNLFTFTFHDPVGMKRQNLRGSIVEQQAILIDTKPYSFVVVLFIIDSPLINITCGYNGNTADLSSMACPTNLVTTEPEAMGTTANNTTGSTESGNSTVGESSTMASGGSINLTLILGISIPIGVVLALALIVIAVLSSLYDKISKSRKTTDESPEYANLRSVDTTDFGQKEKPLGDFSEIRKPKKRMSNIAYDDFFNCVQYIFLTRNENTFNAATTILAAPDIEKTTDQLLTSINTGVYIGMIGQHRVCLVNETDNNFVKKLKEVIIKYFPNAKYIVFVGRCFGIDKTKLNLADIVISKRISYVIEHHSHVERIAPEIRSKFCFFSDEVEGLQVTKYRRAKHLVAKIVSGVNILEQDRREHALIATDEVYGCEETSGELLSLFKTGIDMGNNTTKHMQVITIGAVSGYADMNTVTKYDDWQFIASRAAFHYVSEKMKHPHTSGDISYEVKKPKPMRENDTYAELVKYIIVTIDSDELNAVTTYISAQELKEDTIFEIAEDVYISMIGFYSVGILYLQNKNNYRVDMKNAIDKYFPHTEYLIHVGGCAGIHQNTKLGDVLISKEIYNINYDGESYSGETVEITSDIFCNSHDVGGLQLPGNRTAKHFEVRIATGTGEYMGYSQYMKKKAIENEKNYGYNVIGGALLELQEEMKTIGRKIHFILINGVCRYKNNKDHDEWYFVASQAAIHYVAAKMKKQ